MNDQFISQGIVSSQWIDLVEKATKGQWVLDLARLIDKAWHRDKKVRNKLKLVPDQELLLELFRMLVSSNPLSLRFFLARARLAPPPPAGTLEDSISGTKSDSSGTERFNSHNLIGWYYTRVDNWHGLTFIAVDIYSGWQL